MLFYSKVTSYWSHFLSITYEDAMTKFRIFELSACFKSRLTSFSLARDIFQSHRLKGFVGDSIACRLTAAKTSLP